MNPDEQAVVDYLKTHPKDFVTVREVCRRAGDFHRFHEDPYWAKPILLRLAKKDILETNAYGQYRLKSEPEKPGRKKIPLAPHIQKILEQSGKVFVLDEDLVVSPPKEDAPDESSHKDGGK